MNLTFLLYWFFFSLVSCFPVLAGPPSGRIVGWGYNLLGQATGDPSSSGSGVVSVSGHELTNAISASAGSGHSLALLNGGTVIGWGADEATAGAGYEANGTNGMVKLNGEVMTNVSAIAACGTFNVALKNDGTVAAWGRLPESGGLTGDILALSSGGLHCLAVRRDGTIAAWGGRAPKGLSNIVAVATTPSWVGWDIALKRDGTVVEWNLSGPQPGGPQIMITNEDGSTHLGYEWPDYETVQNLSNVVAVAAGIRHNLALKSDGTVFSWSRNSDDGGTATNGPDGGLVKINGQLLTNVSAIAVAPYLFSQYDFALKRNGTVVAWGPNNDLDPPAGLSNVVAIAAGYNYCLAITTMTNFSNLKK